MLLVDTNVLLSAADTSDRDHLRCAALLDDRTDVAVTAPVAAETAWMLDARLGAAAEIAFIATIESDQLHVLISRLWIGSGAANCLRCMKTSASELSTRPSSPSPNASDCPRSQR